MTIGAPQTSSAASQGGPSARRRHMTATGRRRDAWSDSAPDLIQHNSHRKDHLIHIERPDNFWKIIASIAKCTKRLLPNHIKTKRGVHTCALTTVELYNNCFDQHGKSIERRRELHSPSVGSVRARRRGERGLRVPEERHAAPRIHGLAGLLPSSIDAAGQRWCALCAPLHQELATSEPL